MFSLNRCGWMALTGVLLTGNVTAASVPHILTFQGRLKDSTGAPYSGAESVTFAIYDKDSVELWNSGSLGLTFSGGLVTVQLGEPPQPPLPAAAWASDTSLTLGITIARDPELTPRIPLNSVGHAFHALNADQLDGLVPGDFAGVAHSHALGDLYDVEAPAPSDGQVLTYNSGTANWQPATPAVGGGGGWTDDGNVVRLSTVADRVGAGTATPSAKLEIRGKGTDKKSFNDNDVLMVIPDSPFVGINRDFKVIPQEVFGVHSPRSGFGGMFVSTPTQADFPFYGYSGGGFLNAYHYADPTSKSWHLWNNYADRLIVDSTGDVGIGTQTPLARLNVKTTTSNDDAIRGDATATGSSGGVFIGRQFGAVGSINGSSDPVSRKVAVFADARLTSGGTTYGVQSLTKNDAGDSSVAGLFEALGAGANVGIYSRASGGTTNLAAFFDGNVYVNGTVNKLAGAFRIDHPLDPANQYLQHSFVESPDMKNIYDGVEILDDQGQAEVTLPDWFEALNSDFRYQLTCIGSYAPVYIESEVEGNRFTIAGGKPGMKVSWMVTGIRKDAYAQAHRIQVEVAKRPDERGKYLEPELFGFARAQGLDYRPEIGAGSNQLNKGSR